MPNLQLFGGHFQNGAGVPISGGTLLFTLSHDEEYAVGLSQIVAGQKFTTTLDSSGDIPLTPAFKIWDNASLLPSGSFYIVRLFDNYGAEVWNAPQYWQLTASPNPLDVGTIVPANPPGSGLAGTGGSTLLLQTNEANNGDQSLLDLHAGTGITLTDNGSGRVTIASSTGVTLQVDGVNNADQSKLNFVANRWITWLDAGAGAVQAFVNNAGQISPFQGDGSPIAIDISILGFTTKFDYTVNVIYDSTEVPLVNPGILSINCIDGGHFQISSSSATDASRVRWQVFPIN